MTQHLPTYRFEFGAVELQQRLHNFEIVPFYQIRFPDELNIVVETESVGAIFYHSPNACSLQKLL